MNSIIKIKGMVCRRCVDVVKEIFELEDIKIKKINLGEVEVLSKLEKEQAQRINEVLRKEGFEILDDKQSRLINKIKLLVDEYVNNLNRQQGSFSSIVSENLNLDYDTVSGLFSNVEGATIEHFIIHKRIEKVKDKLRNSKSTLTDIAFEMGYSSVHHLSNQFKKYTGMAPTVFKKLQS